MDGRDLLEGLNMDPATALLNLATAGLNAYAAFIARLTPEQFAQYAAMILADMQFFRQLVRLTPPAPPTP